jgi:hypothetical protein
VPVRVVGPAGAPGSYGGVLVATTAGGTLRTPVTVRQDVEAHNLTVGFLDEHGSAMPDTAFLVVGLDSTDTYFGFGPLALPAEGADLADRHGVAAQIAQLMPHLPDRITALVALRRAVLATG